MIFVIAFSCCVVKFQLAPKYGHCLLGLYNDPHSILKVFDCPNYMLLFNGVNVQILIGKSVASIQISANAGVLLKEGSMEIYNIFTTDCSAQK